MALLLALAMIAIGGGYVASPRNCDPQFRLPQASTKSAFAVRALPAPLMVAAAIPM